MEYAFYTLQDFMVHTKAIAYLLMGAALIGLPLFWRFLNARDEKKRTF
ncbi:MAG: sulfate respiration complex protein HmcD [Thermodesulfobacteriota bacterium]